MKKVAIQGTLGSYHDIAAHKLRRRRNTAYLLRQLRGGICCCQTGQSDHRHAGNRKYDCRKLAAQQ